ncbi:MAG: hypothetical protein WC809_13000 [Sinimarinibacterium sp.]|jgi:hypothetical protein
MCALDPNLITGLSALLTPTIAIVGAIIATNQWRLAEAKFRHDQFDRRFAIFEGIRHYIGSIVAAGYPSKEAQVTFLGATTGARFTFDKATADFIDEVWSKSVDLESVRSELVDMPPGDERTNNIRKQRDLKTWLYDQLKSLENRFDPFLSIKK